MTGADDHPRPVNGRLFVISGAPAAGKTAVGHALAQALERAVFVDGETIGEGVVSGHEPMTVPVTAGALDQLYLRYAGAMALADVYRAGGFDVVLADTIIGSHADDFLGIAAPDPLHLVMLHPSADTLDERDAMRPRPAYGDGLDVDELWHIVEHHTARRGLWLDTSSLSIAQTITRVLRATTRSRVDTVEPAL